MSQQFFDARDLWRTQVPYYEPDRIEGATRTLIHVAVDAEVDRVNRTAPAGERRRLDGSSLPPAISIASQRASPRSISSSPTL